MSNKINKNSSNSKDKKNNPTQDIHSVFLLPINQASIKSIVNSHQVTRRKYFKSISNKVQFTFCIVDFC
jgi:hypothetical protein